jgi:hypothetical protein
MSPVSRRRPPRGPRRTGPSGGTGPDAARLRRQPPLDVLGHELRRLRDATDTFVVEGVAGFVVGLLDVRGPGAGTAYETFCREALGDPRAGTSVLGLQAATVLAELGHPTLRGAAAALVTAADPALRAELPEWCAHVGRVHVVEAGSLRTPDDSETVLHVMLDYDAPTAGARHLLSIAVQHSVRRVHLLDVRAREAHDSLAPIAEAYAGSPTARWTWHGVHELEALVADAVRTTWTHDPTQWPVQDVDGGSTPVWAFGVRRLEQVTGADLRAPR